MFTQIDTTFTVVSQEAEEVIKLGRRRHWRFRIITDFQGVIDKPVFNTQGDWLYMSLNEDDRQIIPNAAYRRHAAIQAAGFGVAQVIIGHELKIAPGTLVTPQVLPSKPKPEVDWGNVAQVAGKGLLMGAMGIAMVSFYALTGALQLVDPSYCIVLNDENGTVVELIRWNVEA
jgi:hypothetical protein